jgi:hypothetical protein
MTGGLHKKKKAAVSGSCKLTKQEGVFVKSHLLPEALTRPERPGLPLFQQGSGTYPVRRWTSWYDDHLVTREGEGILSTHDNWAVAELRRHKLVWSGWDKALDLGSAHHKITGTAQGMRKISGMDQVRLRLFLLTLLRRAAATDRIEFSDVKIPELDLERIRFLICSGDPGPIDTYPAVLTQLSTKGLIHNMTPIAQVKHVPPVSGKKGYLIPIFRFYLDGLIIHFHQRTSGGGGISAWGNFIVGLDDTLLVTTQTYEGSFEKTNLETVQSESLLIPPSTLP